MTAKTAVGQIDLRGAWEALRVEEPSLRIRDAAARLGVSEAELLVTDCGETVTRLSSDFTEILRNFDTLGRVMALTRNDDIVHERKGEYKNVEIIHGHGKMGLAVNDDIDLRIFFAHWHHAFSVVSESPRGTTRSFQFFGSDGTAIHKVFLTEASDLEEYDRIVRKFRAEDQSSFIEVKTKSEAVPKKPDNEIDVVGFREAWSNLKDTHDFFSLMRKFGVSRLQALRLADPQMAREVDRNAFKFVVEEARNRKLPIMIFVGNDGIIQIHTGEVENVIEARGWFNVMDERFNLHINQDKIARAFVVEKPTVDGVVTSLEIFNDKEENVALFFGKRKPGIPESADWQDLAAAIT